MRSNIFMDSNSLSVLNNHFVGVDRLIDQMIYATTLDSSTSYPPYNIVRKSDYEYEIEIACAGFSEENLDVTQTGRELVVSGQKDNKSSNEYLHKGIGSRNFKRKFSLADNVDVKEVTIGNGMLSIRLERYIPEEERPRKIPIGKVIDSNPELLTEASKK